MNPLLIKLGRVGYAAKGLVYIVVGFLATEAAFGQGGKTTDSKGALRTIGEAPFGRIALIIVMIGLFGYAAWRLVSAATDAERRGEQPSSIALRIGEAFRGLAYGSLAVWTLKYLLHKQAPSGNNAPGFVHKVMTFPGGRAIVILAGLGFLVYAIYQIYKAASGKFLKRLNLSSASPATKTFVERFGRFGIVARAVVFGMIGVLIVRAAWTYDPSKAGGIAQSLNAIARQPKGQILYGIVALGLIAFGLLQIATAKYRIMRSA
jgi:hypothetical protein